MKNDPKPDRFSFRPIRGVRLVVGLFLISLQAAQAAPSNSPAKPGHFNEPGNITIADQFNNRVIEVDSNHNIVWSFGDGSSTAGPTSIVAPNDAERIGDWTLISGTGAPAGAEPSCPNGCQDNRVVLVDPHDNIVWQDGQTGVAGDGEDQLNAPVCAVFLPFTFDFLITDQGNQRVIEVTLDHRIVWQYGTTGVTGSGPNQLNNPNSAELLANGNILIADESNNRVIEVNRAHQIVWQYGSPSDTNTLNGVAFASRLPNGNTLMTDAGNNRILEVTPAMKIASQYSTLISGSSLPEPIPTRAVRLQNGNTLISNQFYDQVIEINPAMNIVFTQGMLGVTGTGPNELNAPYDAKVVGDYTGLTPPFLDLF